MSHGISLLAVSVTLIAAAVVTDALRGGPRQSVGIQSTTADQTASLQDRLKLTWGDSRPGTAAPHRFEVPLVDDIGRWHVLAPDRALKAGGDLYSFTYESNLAGKARK